MSTKNNELNDQELEEVNGAGVGWNEGKKEFYMTDPNNMFKIIGTYHILDQAALQQAYNDHYKTFELDDTGFLNYCLENHIVE